MQIILRAQQLLVKYTPTLPYPTLTEWQRLTHTLCRNQWVFPINSQKLLLVLIVELRVFPSLNHLNRFDAPKRLSTRQFIITMNTPTKKSWITIFRTVLYANRGIRSFSTIEFKKKTNLFISTS